MLRELRARGVSVDIEFMDTKRHADDAWRAVFADALAFKRATVSEALPDGISLLRGDLARVSLDEEQWLKLFVCCLRHEDPELTVDALAEVMDLGGYKRAMDAFEALMEDFAPEASEADDPPAAA